jgi:ABC-type dipeptide/oligopeptide/nickel transport system permease component
MAAIEKNGEIDVQEFFKNLNKPRKTVREKLVMQLHWELLLGGIFTVFGLVVFIALGVMSLVGGLVDQNVIAMSCCLGIPTLALGIGLLIAYFSGKKMMKELKD